MIISEQEKAYRRKVQELVQLCLHCYTSEAPLRYVGDGLFECADYVTCAYNQELFKCVACGVWKELADSGDIVEGRCNVCRYCYKHGQSAWSEDRGCWDCADGKPALPIAELRSNLGVRDAPGFGARYVHCRRCREASFAAQQLIEGICEDCWRKEVNADGVADR